jgi:GDP-D-mannose 3',5'-epimerase
MKRALVCGAGGFIGFHLTQKLKALGYFVLGVDVVRPQYANTPCDKFLLRDLSLESTWKVLEEHGQFDEIYQLAARMGGAGYIFTGDNDSSIMSESALINLFCAKYATKWKAKVFFSSSACIYPAYNQLNEETPNCKENTAYPAMPDSEYGWEKLFSERLYKAYERNNGLEVRIARFHNIFGPFGAWDNGKEKAPAAICRKVAMAKDGDTIDIWGDGLQTRSFLYIDECLDGVLRLMHSDCKKILNIGSEQMVSINNLVARVANIANKKININHIEGPLGVRGRNSDNSLIREELGWEPKEELSVGLTKTYNWILANLTKGIKDTKQ